MEWVFGKPVQKQFLLMITNLLWGQKIHSSINTLYHSIWEKSLQTVSIKMNHLLKKENQKKHSPVPVSVIILSGIPAASKRSLCSDIDYLGLPSALRKPNLCNRDDRLKKTTDRTKQNAQHESNRKWAGIIMPDWGPAVIPASVSEIDEEHLLWTLLLSWARPPSESPQMHDIDKSLLWLLSAGFRARPSVFKAWGSFGSKSYESAALLHLVILQSEIHIDFRPGWAGVNHSFTFSVLVCLSLSRSLGYFF